MQCRRSRLPSIGFLCLLTLVVNACASLPVPNSEPFVTIGGKTYESGAYLPSGSEAWSAKERSKGSFDVVAWSTEVAMNRFRYTALLESARLMLPQCDLKVGEVERIAFIAWWRNEIRQQTASLRSTKGSVPGRIVAPQTHERIYNDNETVREIADDHIVEWKLYGCLQTVYGGNSFFQSDDPTSHMDPDVRPSAVHKMDRKFPVPITAQSVEPLEAAGRHMVRAISTGVIRFKKHAYQKAMLTRYVDARYNNLPRREALGALRKPYWR